MPRSINKQKFNEAKEVMKDKMPMMVEYFIQDGMGYLKTISEGIQANDEAKIKSPAHTIKSSSSQLGADKVSDLAKKIEHMAQNMIDGKGGSIAKIKELYDSLEAEFQQAVVELKKLVK